MRTLQLHVLLVVLLVLLEPLLLEIRPFAFLHRDLCRQAELHKVLFTRPGLLEDGSPLRGVDRIHQRLTLLPAALCAGQARSLSGCHLCGGLVLRVLAGLELLGSHRGLRGVRAPLLFGGLLVGRLLLRERGGVPSTALLLLDRLELVAHRVAEDVLLVLDAGDGAGGEEGDRGGCQLVLLIIHADGRGVEQPRARAERLCPLRGLLRSGGLRRGLDLRLPLLLALEAHRVLLEHGAARSRLRLFGLARAALPGRRHDRGRRERPPPPPRALASHPAHAPTGATAVSNSRTVE